MGKYYALAQGADASVAQASEDHYKPQGPADRVPTDPVSIAVALADKIDTLVGFWAINEKPTGSKDPYALRRAALGVIRLIVENQIKLSLGNASLGAISYLAPLDEDGKRWIWGYDPDSPLSKKYKDKGIVESPQSRIGNDGELISQLLSFFADRLKAQLREQGARHDLVDAVFALEGQDDLLMVVRRVEALGKFLDSDDGKNLLAGTKRASNILAIEEKKDSKKYEGAPKVDLMTPIEAHLWRTIQSAIVESKDKIRGEDFEGAMETLSTLRSAVDSFFSKEAGIRVNDDDKAVRENRLKLLNQIREATRAVADFSKIQD